MEIQNKFLKEQFIEYQSLKSLKEQKAFWANFSKEFDQMDKEEKNKVQNGWLANMRIVENRLKQIDAQIEASKNVFEVFPANQEEYHLIEALLKKMNIRFALK